MSARSRELEPAVHVSELPADVQGGMGVDTSSNELAGAVARHEGLGIVSGTANGTVLARKLQDGNEEYRDELLNNFPDNEAAEKIVDEYFVDGGKDLHQPYKTVPMLSVKANPKAEIMNLAGGFVEVDLAKRKSDGKGKVGINILTKLEAPTMSTIYGAMAAGVDVVVMGAGIPSNIPKVINDLTTHSEASIPLIVTGSTKRHRMTFDPGDRYESLTNLDLSRPNFLAIVALSSLAKRLSRHEYPPNGFVVEYHTAGGHNAPPRKKNAFKPSGEPLYGDEDEPDFLELNKIGLPYWLAGGYGTPEGVDEAKANGAVGVLAGGIYALSEESGLPTAFKLKVVEQIRAGVDVEIYTDPLASPTGFPFKVAQIEGTVSDKEVYKSRVRICDLGYLREKYEKENGTIGYRCASEPEKDYKRKGGDLEATIGRACICNALIASVNMAQYTREKVLEPGIVTLNDGVNIAVRRMDEEKKKHTPAPETGKVELYAASSVLNFLRGE